MKSGWGIQDCPVGLRSVNRISVPGLKCVVKL